MAHLLCAAWAGLARADALRAEQLAQQLAGLERRLATAEDDLQAKRAAIAEASDAWARTQSAKTGLRLRQRRLAASLRRRLGVLARGQHEAQSRPWQGTDQLATLVVRERLVRAIAAHDRSLWEQNEATRDALERNVAAQARAKEALAQGRRAQRALRDALAEEHRRRHDALAALRRQKEAGAVLAAHRQQSEQQLTVLAVNSIQASQTQQSNPTSPTEAAPVTPERALPWPAVGKIRARFGEQVELAFGTATRHNGLRIGAPAGARVRAIAAGGVVFADWLPGFGRTVIVAHPGHVHTVHAHLSRMHVRVGELIVPGASLGYVGDSGTTEGAALYFEVRRHGQPQDPLRYLAPS